MNDMKLPQKSKRLLIGMGAFLPISLMSPAGAEEIGQPDRAYYAGNTKAHVFTNESGQTMPYRLFVPRNHDPKKKYPLLLSLHGAGSRGSDNLIHLRPWVSGWIIDAVQKDHPCFILMPQCPSGQQWVDTPWAKGSYSYSTTPIRKPMKLAKEIFDKVVRENSIDRSRIYVMGASMGASMGGYGTWNFIMRYPGLVAAAVPMCGGGDPAMAETIKSIPIWAFHGDKDKVVPLSGSQEMTDAIKKAGGTMAKFTVYPGVGHDCYSRATSDKELVAWVFEQRRTDGKPETGAASLAPTGAIHTEEFNREAKLLGHNRQAQSFLPVKYAEELPGWTKEGDEMPAHFVEQYPGNWAFMLVASQRDENVFTQKEGMAANEKGHVHTVSFDAGAGVYAMISQATAAKDQFAVELLRADGSVLIKHLVAPGKWSGNLELQNHTFTYQGDGTGPLRFRISPVYTAGVRFFGVIDHLQVFRSTKDAEAAVATRQAAEQPAREKMAEAMEKKKKQGRFPSPVPQFTFSGTLAKQLEELKTNELMVRFAESRQRLAADPYRPAYHYVNPESSMNDPNALIFWQGRWHLFFIAMPPDEFPNPADILKRWHRTSVGHAVSDDLVHWQDLPYAINPGIERACYSGGMLVEKDRVIAFYPGMGAGQMVAISEDPLLLNWKKQGPVNTRLGDSCIWKEGDTYYGLTGNKVDYIPGAWWPQMEIWATKDLVSWEALGNFIEDFKTPFTVPRDDGACPDFKRLGDKYILSFFSHSNGGQYFLGDYDKTTHRFKPYHHGRFNHGTVAPGGVHAARMEEDGKGGVFNILNKADSICYRISPHGCKSTFYAFSF